MSKHALDPYDPKNWGATNASLVCCEHCTHPFAGLNVIRHMSRCAKCEQSTGEHS